MGKPKRGKNPGPSLKGIDAALGRKALERVQVVKDGSCLFRAVAHQYYGTQEQHVSLRMSCVEYIKHNKDHFQEFLDRPVADYAKMLSSLEYWGGEHEIVALHRILRRDIVLYREEEGGKVTEKVYNAVSIQGLPPIRLAFMGNEHYDCVYQRGWRKKAGFCQALLFQILYEGVFHEKTPSSVSISKVVERPLPSPTTPSPTAQGGIAEGPSETDRQTTQFSREVLESLSEDHYRNIAVGVYQCSKQAQVDADLSLALAMQTSAPEHKFGPGDDCKVLLSGVLVGGQVRKVLENGKYEVQVPSKRKTYVFSGDKLKRINVSEVTSDAESTTERSGRHPNSKPQTRATGSGSQSRFTRSNESSQPRVVSRQQHQEVKVVPSVQNQGGRQPPRGQTEGSGASGNDGGRKDRWLSRDRTQQGQSAPTYNTSGRTQGKGRYDRPARVVSQDSHQSAASSRGQASGGEQKHLPPATPPDKVASGGVNVKGKDVTVSTQRHPPETKGGQKPPIEKKEALPVNSATRPSAARPAAQQSRAPMPTAPISSPAKLPPQNRPNLVAEPTLPELPSPPSTLPAPRHSSPKAEMDTLSSTSSSSCNSGKIAGASSQPPFSSSFNATWVSSDPITTTPSKPLLNNSVVSTKSDGDEEGHFTAVTAQLPPPPLSDFYDRKFSSLDAFFSEYGRKCFDVYCLLRPTAKEMFESISPPSEWPDLTPPEEEIGNLNEVVSEDDEREEEGDDEEEIQAEKETVLVDDLTAGAVCTVSSNEASSENTSVTTATLTVDEIAMETHASEQQGEQPELSEEDEEEAPGVMPKPVGSALYQLGIPRPAIRHPMMPPYYSMAPGYMPQYQPSPAGWVPPPYAAPPYMQPPYHPSYQYYHPMMMLRPQVQQRPMQPGVQHDGGEEESSKLHSDGAKTSSDPSVQLTAKQSPQLPTDQQNSKQSPLPPSPTSSTSGISSDVAHGNGKPPPPQGDPLEQTWPATVLHSESPLLEEMEPDGEKAASKDVFSSEVTTTESESENWSRPVKRHHEMAPRHKGKKNYSLNRAPMQQQQQQQQKQQQQKQQQQQQQSGTRSKVQIVLGHKQVRRADMAKPKPHPLQFQEMPELRTTSPATQSQLGSSNHVNFRKVLGMNSTPGHVDYDVATDDMSPTAQMKRNALDVALSQYSFSHAEDTIHSVMYGKKVVNSTKYS